MKDVISNKEKLDCAERKDLIYDKPKLDLQRGWKRYFIKRI
jgi:hypothetical protein